MVAFQGSFLNNNNSKMKKARPDPSNPISLSSKRHSLQQDKLIAPQKPEWDTPLQTMDGNNSKTFFSAMKVELSNIRNDFQRLIHREDKNASLGNKEKEVIEQKSGWGTAEKPKSYSSYKQEQRYITQKKGETGSIPKDKEAAQQTVKGFNLTKNFNEAVNFKNKHINARDKEPFTSNNPVSKFMSLETKEEQVKQSNYSSVNSKKYPLNFNESSNDKELLLQRIENQRKKQMSAKLQQEISIYKTQNTHLKAQINRSSEENMLLNQRLIKLQAEMSEKTAQIRIDDENLARYKSIASKAEAFEKQLAVKVKQLNEMQQKFMQFQESVNAERAERQQEVHFYSQKVKELTFYNNNFYNDNTQLTEENLQLKEIVANLQKLNDDSKRMAAQSQMDWNRKIEHLQKNLKQYQKRELMFQKEIERLYQENSHIHREKVCIQHAQAPIFKERKVVQEELQSLRAELQRQKEINSMIVKKYKEELQKLNIEAITSSLQQSIQHLTDQNANLKSQNNTQASKINSLEQQNHALKAEISLYQERDKMTQANRSLTSSEWEEMTEKIQQLQIENKRLAQQHDYRQLLQDVLAQKNTFDVAFELKDEFQTLLRTVKEQMEQIQKLRFQCQKLQIKARICEQDKQELRTHKARLEGQLKAFLANQGNQSGIMHQCDQLRVALQQKQRALRDLKQFVRESLAARTQ